MAQSTHIASGQTALAGSGVTVASGGQATFSLDVTDGTRIPDNIGIPIFLTQGSNKECVGCLTAARSARFAPRLAPWEAGRC